MAKQCKREGCNRPVFSDGYCKNDQYLSPKWQAKQSKKKDVSIHTIKRTPIKKKNYVIKPYNDKRQKQVELYKTHTKPLFFSDPINTVCRRCKREATDVHHSIGRIGWRLNAIEYFIPLCRECHNWVEDHPEQSKEEGLSVNRL